MNSLRCENSTINLFYNLMVSIVGTIIGAAIGAWAIMKLQDSKNKHPRQLLKEIISEFRGYENYQNAKDQFNKRSHVEKKQFLLH